jgi:hypothetical protein
MRTARERAILFEIIAFSRPAKQREAGWEKVPDRADEGAFVATISNIYSFIEEPSPALRAPSPMRAARERAIIFKGITFSHPSDGRRLRSAIQQKILLGSQKSGYQVPLRQVSMNNDGWALRLGRHFPGNRILQVTEWPRPAI